MPELKIKKGVDPVGTTQLVRFQTNNEYYWHKYLVIEVTGAAENTPNQDSPVIWMELAERNPGTIPQFVSLPLSAFDQRVLCNTNEDKFWTNRKTVAA